MKCKPIDLALNKEIMQQPNLVHRILFRHALRQCLSLPKTTSFEKLMIKIESLNKE